jgi:2-polyprenyl-3-methyl-5-hydroxy-6-metoxy-1,4-benzoquinol methylase
LILDSESEKWDKLAQIHDRDREVACHTYLDLIAGKKTKNVELALKLKLGSPMLIEVPYILELIGDVRGKKVLDAGCGGGFYALWLSEIAETLQTRNFPILSVHANRDIENYALKMMKELRRESD